MGTLKEGLTVHNLRRNKSFMYFHLRGDIRHLSPLASVFSLLLYSWAQVLMFIYESPSSHETLSSYTVNVSYNLLEDSW